MIDQDQFNEANEADSKSIIFWWIVIALSACISLIGLCFGISWVLTEIGLQEYAPMTMCGLSAPATLAVVKIL